MIGNNIYENRMSEYLRYYVLVFLPPNSNPEISFEAMVGCHYFSERFDSATVAMDGFRESYIIPFVKTVFFQISAKRRVWKIQNVYIELTS